MAPEGTVNRRIAGRYALLEHLGRGGMGVVWRGRDELLQREVAVKQVELPEWLPKAECESVRARVLREAQAAARVLHPALVTVFDVSEEQSNVYIVMELVAAQSLSQLVAAQGPLSPSRAAQVGLELLSGIEAAHRNGIVHRDVKPSNVMVLE
nr:serine/threonine protein kinase [Actinomycetota bacterium]